MRFVAEGKEFGFTFHYFTLEANEAEGRPERRGIECELFECSPGAEGVTLDSASAVCDSRRQFAKETGRKLALGRVLSYVFPGEGTHFNRGNRALAWVKYHSREGSKINPTRGFVKCLGRLNRLTPDAASEVTG